MKKLLTLALAITSICTLSACTNGIKYIDVLDEFSGDKIEIEFWHVSNDVNGVSPFQKYADSFMEEYPNVDVKLVRNAGNYTELSTNVELSITTNSMPNITIGYSTDFIGYNEVDVVAPLDNFIDHDKWGLSKSDLEDYQKTGFWDDGTSYDKYGTVYSMPLAKGSEAMYVRRDLVEKAGYKIEDLTTWETVFEVSRKLETMNETYTFHHDDPYNFAISLFGQAQAPYTTISGDIQFVNDKLNEKSKQIINEVIYNNKDYLDVRESTAYTYGSGLLENNQVWASICSTTCREYFDNIDYLEILPIPQYSTNHEEHYAVLQGPSMAMLISENQEENLAAWLFMKHLTNTENSSDYAINTGYVPVRASSLETVEFKAFLDAVNDENNENHNRARACSVIIAQSKAYQGLAAFIGASDARIEAGNLVANIVLRNYTLDNAFETAKENLFLYL